MPITDFRAVIFDLDGLVLDSESSYFAAWRLAAAAMGHHLDEAFCTSLSGLHGDSVYQRLQLYCGQDFDITRFNQLSRHHWLNHVRQHRIPIKKGFFPLLNLLQQLDVPFCLATNSRREDAVFCLACAGLENIFATLISRDDVNQGKPAPEIFQTAAAALSLSASDCLVLEDSPVGVAAAIAAGSTCFFVPSRHPIDSMAASQADGMFDDLEQVADFVSARFARRL